MKKLLIIMGSPRQDGICQELINQVRKYFLDCEIKLYDALEQKIVFGILDLVFQIRDEDFWIYIDRDRV